MALTDNLLSYFKLDTNNSSQSDSTGNNDASVTGATYTSSGKISGGYDFDGTGDYIVTDADTGIDGSESRTLTGWCKRDTLSNDVILFTIGKTGTANAFGYYITSGDDLTFTSFASDYDTGIDVDDTDWHFYAITYDGSTVKTYFDGSPTTVPSSSKSLHTSASPLVIGANFDFDLSFEGKIDEVGLWTRALTGEEISSLWNNGDGLTYPFTGETHDVSVSDTANLTDSVSIEHTTPKTHPLALSDSTTLTETFSSYLLEPDYSLQYTEDFESDFGDWTNSAGNDVDWTRDTGSTPSNNTGPTGAANGDYFIFTEASSPFNKTASLEFDTSTGYNDGGKIEFYHHMFGADMGDLFFESYDGSSWSSQWSASGQQHADSTSAYTFVKSTFSSGTEKIRFRGETGDGYRSDMCLDLIKVYSYSGGASGTADKNTFWVNNSGTWVEFNHYEYFRVNKKQNQMSEFEVKIYDIDSTEKVYFKEGAEVLFFAGTNMILKGRIQTIEYSTGFEVIAKGFGMESKLLDKEFIKSGDNRIQYTNESAQTVVTEINSDILTTHSSGIFDTDYGDVSLRFEYANRLNALGKTAEALDYYWWVSQTSSNDYDTDYLHFDSNQGETSSQKTFDLTSSCHKTSQEKDINSLVNYVHALGYGDGINQLSTSCYAASTQSSLLNSNIDSTDTSVLVVDSSDFDATGSARMADEVITYAGISTNTLTGCSRGVGTTARAHNKGCYIEQHYTTDSAQTGSSVQVYGLMDKTLIDKTIVDRETLEIIASRYLMDRKTPIIRIKIESDEPITDAGLNIGDNVTVTDSEADISGDYRIVGQEFESNYGFLKLTTEVSNRSLEFIEQMNKAREDANAMAKYMQGSTNIYAINEAENCDSTHYLNLRFFIPNEAVAINKVLLNFKLKDFRSSHLGGADYITIPGGGWLPEFGGAAEGDDLQRGGNYFMAGNNANTAFFPVDLPDGAVVTRAIVYGNAGATAETWSLRREEIAGSAAGVMASANFDSADTSISNATIDNETYVYYLESSTIDDTDEIHGGRIDFTAPTYAIREEELTDPSVDLYTGEDGESMTKKATYTTDQTEIDLTTEASAVGAGKWVNLQFRPNKNMRIEADAHCQIFIESKT